MRVYPNRLDQRLRETLDPVYLITGDEPLQLNECCDRVRKQARSAGYASREVLEAGPGFDWQQLITAAASMSLFADKRLIDLRVPGGKPGSEGSKAIVAYCAAPPPDTLLLLTLPKLDRQQLASKWFKALDAVGITVQVWPVGANELPGWIDHRMRSAGLVPTTAATELLAARVEGNLLAASQEIEKLLLLRGPGTLDAEQLLESVTDSARYDVFELVDTALRQDPARCIHILEGLRGDGTAAAVVLWALHREAQLLARIGADCARGTPVDNAMAAARVFRNRTALVRHGLENLRTAQWLQLLDLCLECDRRIKGLGPGDPWVLLQEIALTFAGQSVAAPTAMPSRPLGG